MTLSKLSIRQYSCGFSHFVILSLLKSPKINQRIKQVSLPLGAGLVAMGVAWKVFWVQMLLSLAAKENIAHLLSFLAAPGSDLPWSVSHSEAPSLPPPSTIWSKSVSSLGRATTQDPFGKKVGVIFKRSKFFCLCWISVYNYPKVSEETWVFSLAWSLFCFVFLIHLELLNWVKLLNRNKD